MKSRECLHLRVYERVGWLLELVVGVALEVVVVAVHLEQLAAVRQTDSFARVWG